MLDILATIQSYLSIYWQETSPMITDIAFKQDEYDPKNPALQILLENLPDLKRWVLPNLQRVEHRARLTLYLKPVRYDSTTIADCKMFFTNAKTEIDRIFTYFKFSMGDFRNLSISGWDDKETIRRGYGTKGERVKEPIQFRSILIITSNYYVSTNTYTQNQFPYIFLA